MIYMESGRKQSRAVRTKLLLRVESSFRKVHEGSGVHGLKSPWHAFPVKTKDESKRWLEDQMNVRDRCLEYVGKPEYGFRGFMRWMHITEYNRKKRQN